MNKEEFLTYLPETTYGLFTTVKEDGTPETRGWEFQFEQDDRYYFGTANTKDVWAELTKNPKAGFTYMEPTGKYTVRMTGEVKVLTDPEEKKALFERFNPMVRGMYQSWDNPIFEIILYASWQRALRRLRQWNIRNRTESSRLSGILYRR